MISNLVENGQEMEVKTAVAETEDECTGVCPILTTSNGNIKDRSLHDRFNLVRHPSSMPPHTPCRMPHAPFSSSDSQFPILDSRRIDSQVRFQTDERTPTCSPSSNNYKNSARNVASADAAVCTAGSVLLGAVGGGGAKRDKGGQATATVDGAQKGLRGTQSKTVWRTLGRQTGRRLFLFFLALPHLSLSFSLALTLCILTLLRLLWLLFGRFFFFRLRPKQRSIKRHTVCESTHNSSVELFSPVPVLVPVNVPHPSPLTIPLLPPLATALLQRHTLLLLRRCRFSIGKTDRAAAKMEKCILVLYPPLWCDLDFGKLIDRSIAAPPRNHQSPANYNY
uniref:HDC17826 n=1 Tax=Drosophila melanogaster TaxID=7227 RepID=Q6IIJ9_DROME|nr:TPA_inf: HDC17826 [Drosophila melanogaster]